MDKLPIHHHASLVLAKCDSTGEFLLAQYDSGYPGKNKHWIGRAKMIGGNFFLGKNSDNSPYETFQREIAEEFSGEKAAKDEMASSQRHRFASQSDIKFVRDVLLSANPEQDFLIYTHETEIPHHVLISIFRANLDKKVIECVKDNLSGERSITNEGLLTVRTITDLVKGNPLCQAVSGVILGNCEGVYLPYCFKDIVTCAPIGKLREFYTDYLDSFQYLDHSKK